MNQPTDDTGSGIVPPVPPPLGDDEPDRADDLGGRIRPYALTGGRTRSVGAELPLETLVRRTAHGSASLDRAVLERRRILELADLPVSIAELSAHLRVHLGVARVLVGDMTTEGLLSVHRPRPVDERPDIALLERVLDGLKAL